MIAGDRTPELSALFVDSRMLTGISVFIKEVMEILIPECECGEVARWRDGKSLSEKKTENRLGRRWRIWEQFAVECKG